MADENSAAVPEQAPAGNMLFYRQPELLNHETHGGLGLRRPERPWEFARHTRAMPLTMGEIAAAQRCFPVVFSSLEEPVPLAVVGATDDVNLFVDDRGQWESRCYIPAYARCYPFALAARSDEEYAVVIDRAADSVSESPEQPFFDGTSVTPQTQTLIDFCGRYDAERKATAAFGKRLKDLGVLSGQQVTRTMPDGTEEPLASYVAVDVQKLNGLGASVIHELFGSGDLAAIFAHLFSLENWKLLTDRHMERAAAGTG